MNTPSSIDQFFKDHKADTDWIGVRSVDEYTQYRVVRNEIPEANMTKRDRGVMIEVLIDGHIGYSGTSDVSSAGLERAFKSAVETTRANSIYRTHHADHSLRPLAKGTFHSPRRSGFDALSLAEITDRLIQSSKALNAAAQIVSRTARALLVETETRYITSSGSDVLQNLSLASIELAATAQEGSESQTRTFTSDTKQIGAEVFEQSRLLAGAELTAREVLELIHAENCPSDVMDLIALPDQMMLQIHESIGHPLELDRILGDERNYAGWSFVKPEDFGHLQYGSKLMNVTFDPTVLGQFASYAFDDGGSQAKREFLIKDGLLLRGLGGLESQKRAQLSGVANFRASSWNRAPIDRMANINLEPGETTLEEMISSVERGLLVKTNRSWSIDDYRNKFQFGCEYGQLIKDGQITKTVKNPNYRGITIPFWQKLKALGSANLSEIHGTPYCGKGEPNQVIRVGHATPPCLFEQIEIFGGQG